MYLPGFTHHFKMAEQMKIISGGQTGADRAALDAAIQLGIDHGGWLPRGRKTEDGPLPLRYQLKELGSYHYRQRTEQNVIDSDGTLLCSFGALKGGTALTEAFAIKHNRPFVHIDFDQTGQKQARQILEEWLVKHAITVLNVAGSRLSSEPRIYAAVYELLIAAIPIK